MSSTSDGLFCLLLILLLNHSGLQVSRDTLCENMTMMTFLMINACSLYPDQIVTDAIINSGPREDSTRIGRAGKIVIVHAALV